MHVFHLKTLCLVVSTSCLSIIILNSCLNHNYAFGIPVLNDSNLEIELLTKGLSKPTSMAFLAPDDILVLEQEKGTIQRVKNGVLLSEPILDVNVGGFRQSIETGMLGIAIAHVKDSIFYLFVYYTIANTDGGEPIANQLYRYTFIDDPSAGPSQGKVVASKLLLNLHVAPHQGHHFGGRVTIGPDGNVYLPVGDMQRETKTQNVERAPDPNGTGGILRFTQDGGTVGSGILGDSHPLNKYFAYGIRNSFGLGFDPVSGKLWITENGPASSDEINLVDPGFNSGWKKIMGLPPTDFNFTDLVSFNGKGNYSNPKFVWAKTVAPTAIAYLNSTKLGTDYQYDMFVGDVNTGRIYRFDLNPQRTDLLLSGPLLDKVANNDSETQSVIFGRKFNSITDLKSGPDGYLYALSYWDGAIYRVVPKVGTLS